MKKIKYYILTFLIIALFGCSEEYSLEDQGITLAELPGYVAFDAPGTSTNLVAFNAAESDDNLKIKVEVPTGTLSNVLVGYSLSGTAIFGTDYTISDADSSGGTLVIPHIQSTDPTFSVPDFAEIEIDFLIDNVADGDKTIVITLLSASNDEKTLAVGRGGTDFLKTATVNIADVD
ncbi:MAG: hypothetical protein ACK5H1_06030 [Tenacibaculum sp.]